MILAAEWLSARMYSECGESRIFVKSLSCMNRISGSGSLILESNWAMPDCAWLRSLAIAADEEVCDEELQGDLEAEVE